MRSNFEIGEMVLFKKEEDLQLEFGEGDKVEVSTWRGITHGFSPKMLKYCGKSAVVVDIVESGLNRQKIIISFTDEDLNRDTKDWSFSDDMLKKDSKEDLKKLNLYANLSGREFAFPIKKIGRVI